MEATNFQLTIYSRKYWSILIFLIPVLYIIARLSPGIYNFSQYIHTFLHYLSDISISHILGLPLYYFFLFVAFKEVAWLMAKVKINIDSENLILTTYFWGIPFSNTYNTSRITNFTVKHDGAGPYGTNSIIYTLKTGEYWKPILKDSTVLYFDYNGKTKSIGKHLNSFPAEEIIKEVEKRSTKNTSY